MKTDYMHKILHVVSWIIFIGVCIETGAFIFSTIFTLWLTPAGTGKLWIEVDLSALYSYSQSHFVTVSSLMIITSAMRAILFYVIVKTFYEKKFNLSQPFNETVKRFISNVAYLALGIGMFSFWGSEYTQSMVSLGVKMPDLQHLRLAGADVWLFMGVTLLVIVQILKKGIELQNENDLTV